VHSRKQQYKQPTEAPASCNSNEEFLLDLFSKKGTVKQPTEAPASCFSREEFFRGFAPEKGDSKTKKVDNDS